MRSGIAALWAVVALAGAWAPPVAGQADKEKKDHSTLDAYLTDVNAGMVSAGSLVGLQDSAIQEVQTSQDLIVALKPFSSGSSKRAFGLAITPARTSFVGMSAERYRSGTLMRIVGSTTLSYAEAAATISSVGYTKNAMSIDAFYFPSKGDDPIFVAQEAFKRCEPGKEAERRIRRAFIALEAAEAKKAAAQARLDARPSPNEAKRLRSEIAEAEDEIAAATKITEGDAAGKEAEEAFQKCIDADLEKVKWNATRIQFALGAGWIRPEDRALGSRKSLGRHLTLSSVFGAGEQGAVNISVRRTNKEVDLTTLAGSPTYLDSTLMAARYTYGSKSTDGDWKALVEISNAKKTKITEANRVFMHAVGVDKKLGKGTWLQFRLGRNRTIDGTTTETTGLMTLNFAPSAGLFN